MNTRVIAATTAAIVGLLLAGCDNTETEEAPEAPAGTSAPLDESTGEGDEADGPDNETGGVGDGDLGEEEGAG